MVIKGHTLFYHGLEEPSDISILFDHHVPPASNGLSKNKQEFKIGIHMCWKKFGATTRKMMGFDHFHDYM